MHGGTSAPEIFDIIERAEDILLEDDRAAEEATEENEEPSKLVEEMGARDATAEAGAHACEVDAEPSTTSVADGEETPEVATKNTVEM